MLTSTGGTTGPRTDASGDDTAEYLAPSRTVRVRAGRGATATAGGTLNPNDAISFRFRATVDRAAAGTTVTNSAALDYRARTINKTFTFLGNQVSTNVADIADLAIAKSSDPTSQDAGSAVTYRLTATNNGPTAAQNVVVVDTLPAGVTYVSSSPPPGTSCAAAGQKITCTAVALANGAILSIPITTIIGTADSGRHPRQLRECQLEHRR